MKNRFFLALLLWVGLARADEEPGEWAAKRLSAAGKPDGAGVAVLVGREGKILFQGATGMADIAANVPVTVETKFRIGSVTKQFTAAAILKLAEEGKLAVTDPLAKFFPDVPNAPQITLRHLLTHTSGLHSYTGRPDFMSGVAKPVKPMDLITTLKGEAVDFAPGTGFSYCNTGYFLLGEIVAQVSGRSFDDYLRTTFFEPLGMKNTGIYLNAAPPSLAALGYAVEKDKANVAVDWDMSWAGGAGALYSTVGDLFLWNEALYGGKILNAESLKAMTTANPLPAGVNGLDYGYGLVVSNLHRLPEIGHNGGLNGWSSHLTWLPAQRCTLVALANAMPTAPDLEPATLVRDLAKQFLAADIAQLPPPKEDKTVDPKIYADFVGRYDYSGAIMTVTADKDHLFAQLTGQKKFEIFPQSKEEYFWKITDAWVRFLRDENGAVVAAQHTQNGFSFRAPRLVAPKIELSAEQLDAFVGQYQYGPVAVMKVTRDGTQLMAQLTGQPRFPIFPTAEDSFEWQVVPAKVQFVKGDDGKVAKAVHQQNGLTFDAPKIK